MPKFYAVAKGNKPGIYTTWSECQKQVKGFSGAIYKSFQTKQEAQDLITKFNEQTTSVVSQPTSSSLCNDDLYLLRFDGASRGNPGKASYGFVIYDPSKKIVATGKDFIGYKKTNNEAEYEGLINGLQRCVDLKLKKVLIEGDSQLIINHLHGLNNVVKMKLYFDRVKVLLDQLDTYTVNHIYRSFNKEADALANQALDEQR
jgi:ribonuclease HI